MEFIPLESNSASEDAKSDGWFGIAGESHGRDQLKEQNLLMRFEEFSDDKSEATVDCTLKLGFSSDTKPKTSRFDPTPRINGPPIICGAPQVMQWYGVMSRGWSTYNNSRWGSMGSSPMNLLPYMGYYGGKSTDGIYGSFGDRSMASSSSLAHQSGPNGLTGLSNGQQIDMSRVYKSKSERDVGGCVRKCATCQTTSTPLWRNGPMGSKSLCNACGIRYKKEERKKEEGKGSGVIASRTKSEGGGIKEHESSKKPKI